VWLYLKECFLSHRLHADYDAIIEAACNARNRLKNETGRIKSLCCCRPKRQPRARGIRLGSVEHRFGYSKRKEHQKLAKRIKVKDNHIIVFDEVLATFRVMAERDGLEILKPDVMREVRQAAASITLNPHLARAFQGGIPEVSVFWVDDYGIPCKCRLDWLKPRTHQVRRISALTDDANWSPGPLPLKRRHN